MFKKALLAHQEGRIDEAARLYERVIKAAPGHAGAWNNLGLIHLARKEYHRAMECFGRAADISPGFTDPINNTGVCLLELKRPEQALKHFETAAALAPDDPQIMANRGTALFRLGRMDQARELLEKALEIDPGNADVHNNLANILMKKGDHARASFHYLKAADLAGPDETILFNLCQSLVETGRFEDAISVAEQAMDLFPESERIKTAAARVFIDTCNWEKADDLLPSLLERLETGRDAETLRHLLLPLNASVMGREKIARAHMTAGAAVSAKNKPPVASRGTGGDEKIRIGYLSADFRRHSVGWFMAEILQHHDLSRFEVFCYSLSETEDDLTEKIKESASFFRRVSQMHDKEIAGLIARDRIQVLVDLGGYSKQNRLDVFAFRPAPVQITAIGYPHGTGLLEMDFRLTDPLAEGTGHEAEYRERLLYMPDLFLPFPRFETRGDPFLRSELGIGEKEIIFVSFNALHKLRPEVLYLWKRILEGIGHARLLFSFKGCESSYIQGRIGEYFGECRKRIIFLERTGTEEEHRARYRVADIALDTFPYSGTTTSFEALFMGVPVITLKGERHVQRTTFSILYHLGIPELAAGNPEEYERIARDMACNPNRLVMMKKRVKDAVEKRLSTGNRPYVANLEKIFMSLLT